MTNAYSIRRLPTQPFTLSELSPALNRIWNNIPREFVLNLISWMVCFCQLYIDANGDQMWY
jgi:hypothetical protein